MKSVTGLVLAGGRSSRMGTNKALLQLNGETLLERAGRKLSAAGCKKILVSGDYPGYDCVKDEGFLGPLAGISAGLQACETARMLVLPVDMPFMMSELLHLLTTFGTDSHGLFYSNQPFPLLLNNNHENRSLLLSMLAPDVPENERSLFRFIRMAGFTSLPISPRYDYCFQNTNTPDEWQDCQNQLNGTYKG